MLVSTHEYEYGQLFTLHAGYGTIQGRVFHDIDGDGVFDPNLEPGIAAVTVYVDVNGNCSPDAGEPSGNSDGAAYYYLQNVPPGVHTLAVVPINELEVTQSNAPSGVAPHCHIMHITVNADMASTRDIGMAPREWYKSSRASSTPVLTVAHMLDGSSHI